ncbi:protein kinase domain-containing protein [Roseixanthobacter pseudopolyaromaticivorans]|uniref:protein kinase domain-containing protein n=1 Tax=Xanthobacteraceae TaxID=335928 RepID=UPI0037292CDB
MAGYSPAAEAIELFLTGDIGVQHLGERLATCGVAPDEIAGVLAHFVAAGRLPERLAALLLERARAGAMPERRRALSADPRRADSRRALPPAAAATPAHGPVRSLPPDPADLEPAPPIPDPAARWRTPLPQPHEERTLRPVVDPRRAPRPLPLADERGGLGARPVLDRRGLAPGAVRAFEPPEVAPSADAAPPAAPPPSVAPDRFARDRTGFAPASGRLAEDGAARRPLLPPNAAGTLAGSPPQPGMPNPAALRGAVPPASAPQRAPLPLPTLPTRPRGRTPLAAAPDTAETPPAVPRAHIDDSITSALLSGLKGLRHKATPPQGPGLSERHLDGWLSGFRSMRVRRQADLVHEGERLEPKRLPAEAPKLATGFMLKDRFVLDDELGHGGMGEVFRAVDRRRLEAGDPDPYVALKVLSAQFRLHPDALAALEAEARKVQLLSHPNICPIFDFDRDGPHAFFVMELLQGETLDLALRRAPGAPLEAPLPARVVSGVLAAMSHAHALGIVHGDLKPGNVFLTREGLAKVLDFGVAVALRGGGFNPEGLAAYTPAFSSPEMIAGAPRDPRDDVFSLGCLIYLVYAGQHPYGRRPAGEAAQLGLVPEPIFGMPHAAWLALERALAFRREDRPADARALAAALLPSLIGRRGED